MPQAVASTRVAEKRPFPGHQQNQKDHICYPDIKPYGTRQGRLGDTRCCACPGAGASQGKPYVAVPAGDKFPQSSCPLDRGLVVFLAFLCYLLASFERASSRASLGWVFVLYSPFQGSYLV